MVYIYRGLYNGVAANYIIKSNSLTNFGIASGVWGRISHGGDPAGEVQPAD